MDNKKNTGNWNVGDWNTGNYNTGNHNTGSWNAGNYNNGGHNAGLWNTGNYNVGSWNTGDHNDGNSNSGDYNAGHCNTGGWNIGGWNTGYCNTNNPKVRIFNQSTNLKADEILFPNFFHFKLIEWVLEENMSDKEKESYPSYVTCGGYLKCKNYKQAWRESWDDADIKDRKKVMELPNWDNDIFKEISGIDVEKELNEKSDKKQNLLDKADELIKKAEELKKEANNI